MKYVSTRSNYREVEATEAILLGMVPEGGLFVPEAFPIVNLEAMKDMAYLDLAVAVFKLYLTEYSTEEIQKHVEKAYSKENFDHEDIVPVTKIDNDTAMLDLWHGPTAAFKDVALQIMPLLLTSSAKKQGIDKEIVILVATSGDTGKSALEGYKNVEGTKIIVFYPKNGVSEIQKLQMVTSEGNNTFVVGVDGNFDDCQTAVKKIFGDKEYVKAIEGNGYKFSSANSINIGRLLPQVVYYFWGYFEMVRKGMVDMNSEINLCVPTGNFGDILAGWYAHKMGLPVKKFICASNSNKVLTDFIRNGEYNNVEREFYRTCSPSMDILISSNLERLIYEYAGPEKVRKWYKQLHDENTFKLDDDSLRKLQNEFYGDFATEEETVEEIGNVFKEHKILIDTHTAVGMNILRKYRIAEPGDKTPCLVNSTASPFKFSKAVMSALNASANDIGEINEFDSLNKIKEITGEEIHRAVAGLLGKKIFHDKFVDKEGIKGSIDDILNLK